MAKKQDYSAEYEKIVDNTKIIPTEINGEVKRSFMAYAMAVNISRAIPDVRDGLKPVHRRILYDMGAILGLYNDKPYVKCARIVGDVLGKFHPHGDSSVYMALVRLAQDFSTYCPLVDGHGNFGSIDGDGPAAYRYTEARLSKISAEMLRDIDKETVDFAPNFDGTIEQPVVLPSRFPNLLVNGSDGIAVGMATNIPPHNLGEVIDAVIAQIDNPDIEVDDLMNYLPAPDFPTGGLIMGTSGVKMAYKTGRGAIVIRARAEIEEDNGKNRIIVTEIPYQVNKSALIISIADLVKNKRIEGISDIKDESDRKGLRIVIDVKKDYQANVVLNTLYKHTQLQISFGIIMLALADGTPKVLGLKEINNYYIKHQEDIITRRTKYDLARAEERAHIVEGLVIALANIDEVIQTIKASADRNDAINKLTEQFVLTEKQAAAILDMKLQRLTSLEVEKLKEELEQLHALIAELKGILADERKILDIVKKELTEIKEKYGSPRKTEISIDYSDINIEDLIEKEDVVVSITHQGYVKRLPVAEYRSQNRGGKGATAHKPKDEDFVENLFITNTHNSVLFFSSLGKVYSIKAYEVPEAQKQARGRAIINLLQLAENEKITAVIPLPKDLNKDGNLMMATRLGMIKKTALSEFESIRKVGKIAIDLAEGDTLISVQITNGNDEILVASSDGKSIRFSEKDVRPLGRDTRGVRSMNLNPEDCIVDMIALKPDLDILTISSLGYGKRSPLSDFRLQTRAGKGVKAGQFNEKTGKMVGIKQVVGDEDVMMIANNGTVLRTPVESISRIGRDTQGVRVMKLANKVEITSIELADHFAEHVEDPELGFEVEEAKPNNIEEIQPEDQPIMEQQLDFDPNDEV